MSDNKWTIKSLARRLLATFGLDIRRAPRAAGARTAAGREPVSYSHLDEQNLIRKSLGQLGAVNRFCVDIAASDGTTMSNTYSLFESGWAGVAAECDSDKFAKLAATYARFPRVDLMKCMVTPDNVVALLQTASTPEDFGFLNLDIDGYDYFVLEKILHRYRPRLICVEVNEKIPPPIKFTVRWDPRYAWAGDHFYGASIAKMHELCVAHHYALTELHYNSAILIPDELADGPSLTPEQAWQQGYRDKADRRERFPWNDNMEDLITLSPSDAMGVLRERFRDRDGMFDLGV